MKIEKVKDNNKLGLYPSSIVDVKETLNTTEVKHMTKRTGGIIRRISRDLYYDIRTGEVKKYKHSINKSENKDSVAKSLKALRELIDSNISNTDTKHKNVLWVTLTYQENMTDTKRLYKDFKNFNNRFKNYLKKNNHPLYEYIAIAEPQRRGAWHLHVLFIFKKKSPFVIKKTLENIWGHGYVSINLLKNVDNVSAYVCAYLTDLDISDMVNDSSNNKARIKGGRLKMYPSSMKLFRHSKGIRKPIKYKTTEEEIQKKLKNSVLKYEKTIQIRSESGSIFNRINYRHYTNLGGNNNKKL